MFSVFDITVMKSHIVIFSFKKFVEIKGGFLHFVYGGPSYYLCFIVHILIKKVISLTVNEGLEEPQHRTK